MKKFISVCLIVLSVLCLASCTDSNPPVTTEEPAVTTAEPAVTTAEPVVTTAELVVTTAEPVVTTAEPVVTTVPPITTSATTLPPETTEPAETTAPVETTAFDLETSDLSQYVMLGKYLGIEVFVNEMDKVEDADVEEQLALLADSLPEDAMIKEGACLDGQKVNINFVGRMDGVLFDGGSAENFSLVLGSNSLIDGFEEGVVGMTVGETKDLELTFPMDYYEELCGKAVTFTVTLNYIYPTLDDEIVKTYFNVENLDSLKAAIRGELEANAKQLHESEKQTAAWAKAIANSLVAAYPEELLDKTFNVEADYYRAMAEANGMTYETIFPAMFGLSLEEAEVIIRENSKNIVSQQLILYAIARDMGLDISDETFESQLEAIRVMSGLSSVDELVASFNTTKEDLKELLIFTEVVDEIVKTANFVYTEKQ